MSARRYLAGVSRLLIAAMLILPAACSKQENVVSVGENDVEMNAAIAKARETLPQFWDVYEKRAAGEEDFSLKVKITDGQETEHFWATEIVNGGGQIMGTISNDPEFVSGVKLGDRIKIPEGDISDWSYRRGGKIVGNHTMRVLLKRMPAEEAAQYRSMLAEPE